MFIPRGGCHGPKTMMNFVFAFALRQLVSSGPRDGLVSILHGHQVDGVTLMMVGVVSSVVSKGILQR